MHGLPDNIDLSFFVGKHLEQIAFGPAQIQFFFSDKIHIGLGGKFSHSACGKTSVWEEGQPLINATCSVSLIGARVIDIQGVPDGTITMTFSNDETLVLYDDSNQYESYTIRHGDDVFVV